MSHVVYQASMKVTALEAEGQSIKIHAGVQSVNSAWQTVDDEITFYVAASEKQPRVGQTIYVEVKYE